MLTSEKLKAFIHEKCGDVVVGIAPGTPFKEEDKKRYNFTYETLSNANPVVNNAGVFDPEEFVDNAKSVIVVCNNAYFGPNPYKENGKNDIPRGEIADAYVNDTLMTCAQQRLDIITTFLEENGYKAAVPFTGFLQKTKALEAGVGTRGKNTLIINSKFGSYHNPLEIITDAPLEPEEPINKDCGACKKCVDACPTGALSKPYVLQPEKCINFMLFHLKEEISFDSRGKIGTRLGGCSICSDACPHNSSLEINEKEKAPDSVVYPELIPLMNLGEEEYEKKYGAKMLGFFMGERRYLRRNVAVALGNAGNSDALSCLEIAASDEDRLVSSHAEWAIEKIKAG